MPMRIAFGRVCYAVSTVLVSVTIVAFCSLMFTFIRYSKRDLLSRLTVLANSISGKDTAKIQYFSFPMGDIDHLSCLIKWNIPSKVEFANTIKTAVKAGGARTGKPRYSIYILLVFVFLCVTFPLFFICFCETEWGQFFRLIWPLCFLRWVEIIQIAGLATALRVQHSVKP